MTSEKKKAANKRNALSSTGPRSLEGKNRASMNALKHGLLSSKVLLPGEDAEEYENLQHEIFSALCPSDKLKEILVARIGIMLWRLHRACQIEAGLLTERWLEVLKERAAREKSSHEDKELIDLCMSLKGPIADSEAYATANQRLIEISRQMGASEIPAARAFRADASDKNMIHHLQRYETANERSLLRLLNLLGVPSRRDGGGLD